MHRPVLNPVLVGSVVSLVVFFTWCRSVIWLFSNRVFFSTTTGYVLWHGFSRDEKLLTASVTVKWLVASGNILITAVIIQWKALTYSRWWLCSVFFFCFLFFCQALYYTKPSIHNLRETEGGSRTSVQLIIVACFCHHAFTSFRNVVITWIWL